VINMFNSIGIVGHGFVGAAVHEGLRRHFSIETYDKYKKQNSTCASLVELASKAKIIFICLPTPMTTRQLNSECNNVSVVFNPEFLTEANYIDDFKSQNRIIIGGPRPASTIIKNLYKKAFYKTPIIKTGSDTAEMVKYFCNCLLATKVSFANEIKQICDKIDIDYDKVLEYSLYDERIGNTHLTVPGPDGRLGFGGSCFPKDINALITLAKSVDVDAVILDAVWNKNLEIRPDKDWEKLLGRAISYDKV